MNELPKVDALEALERARTTQIGVEAVEAQLRTEGVEISLWVRGREIRTVTDDATVQRIMALLTGIEP